MSRQKIGGCVFLAQDFGRCFTALKEVILEGLNRFVLPFGA